MTIKEIYRIVINAQNSVHNRLPISLFVDNLL